MEKNMDELQHFMNDCIDSSRWYHGRSDAQKAFDKIMVESLNRNENIKSSIKNAIAQMPEMCDFAMKSIFELNKYYSELQRIEQEIAISNNFRMMAAMRKRKAQQGN